MPGHIVPESVQRARALMQLAYVGQGLGVLDDRALLTALDQAHRLTAQVHALTARLVAEAHGRESTTHISRVPTAQWLHLETHALTLQAFRGQVVHAHQMFLDWPEVADAQARGEVSHEQARAIVRALRLLPDDLDPEARDRAVADMLRFAQEFNPHELEALGQRMLEVVAPGRAEELEAERLERQRRKAERERHLSIYPDHHGSWFIKGKIPNAAGEQLADVLDAIVERRLRNTRDAVENGDGTAGTVPDRLQARADALMEIITAYSATGAAPTHGGDRPRVTVTIRLEDLLSGLGHATSEAGVDLPATEARLMACDADVIPAVLNSDGVPLDVDRTHRLVTAGIRATLWLRDKGCVFPGCDRSPRDCDAHHVIPWCIGGITALKNLVLLCPSHHALVEPACTSTAVIENPLRWEVRFTPRGLPEFLPPRSHDYTQRPLMHARFRLAP